MQSLPNLLDIPFDFDAPQFLLLLFLLPLFWFVSRRSLAALGSWRRRIALVLRVAVASSLIIALAEPNWLRILHWLCVIFVVDVSGSIHREELDSALKYVAAAAQQRDTDHGDRAGAVVFGREPAVEIPPVDVSWQIPRVESPIDSRFTSLETALQLAEVAFPSDSARRVVLVSDGNENVGSALPLVTRMLEAGIGFDCVPVSFERRGEIYVEKVVAPAETRRGTPFTVNVVLINASDRAATGTLHIMRELASERDALSSEHVTLTPGKRVLTLRQELTKAGMTTFEARFVPERHSDNAHSENNAATAFCHVAGNGRVLLMVDASQAGRFDAFVDMLRRHDLEVTVHDTRRPFDDLTDLQEFDCVVACAGRKPRQLPVLHQRKSLRRRMRHWASNIRSLRLPPSHPRRVSNRQATSAARIRQSRRVRRRPNSHRDCWTPSAAREKGTNFAIRRLPT